MQQPEQSRSYYVKLGTPLNSKPLVPAHLISDYDAEQGNDQQDNRSTSSSARLERRNSRNARRAVRAFAKATSSHRPADFSSSQTTAQWVNDHAQDDSSTPLNWTLHSSQHESHSEVRRSGSVRRVARRLTSFRSAASTPRTSEPKRQQRQRAARAGKRVLALVADGLVRCGEAWTVWGMAVAPTPRTPKYTA
ncbi:hypothetical protein BWQ96_06987 [Gracilariopsis chorda]|uniref:Uncharacterized protein n=1 Tax=Gracilariopsis chorda TaxID=448386 RepID=A0A2V3IQ52_9FLOR|nr:hypothetical protein BWQ96_06987 [Gracilariopsis chorda]|eukprot:PXF43260.1 hypothetical protein BWQ96_06987 [Gracilariopsis chorda]